MTDSRTPILLGAVALMALACSSDGTSDTIPIGTGGGGAVGGSGGQSAGASGSGALGGAGATGGAGTGGQAGATTGGASGTGGTGGSLAGGGGSSGTAGGAGGAGAGGAGAGGTAGGGASGAAGSAGDAGSTSGGSSGQGGASGAGAGGGAGAGSGGGSSNPVPSAGCGKSGRPSGGVVTVSNQHIYTFPTSYDGTTPYPLLVGMHAAGNPIDEIKTLTDGSDIDKNYVRAFPKSAGNEWVYNTDLSKVLSMYDELVSTYCIDTSRVFATGHSSGAQMIVQILTHADSAMHMGFKAVAPVAASDYGALVVPMPVMYIQGKNDSVRNSDGHETVARFTKANTCGTTTMPYTLVPACMSSGMSVNAGCISYDGCTVPTVWCAHNDPAYSGTSHGWPCFATKAMYDFFEALP